MTEPIIEFVPDDSGEGSWQGFLEAAARLLIGLGESEGDESQDAEE
jgi:hypothetical protein